MTAETSTAHTLSAEASSSSPASAALRLVGECSRSGPGVATDDRAGRGGTSGVREAVVVDPDFREDTALDFPESEGGI